MVFEGREFGILESAYFEFHEFSYLPHDIKMVHMPNLTFLSVLGSSVVGKWVSPILICLRFVFWNGGYSSEETPH